MRVAATSFSTSARLSYFTTLVGSSPPSLRVGVMSSTFAPLMLPCSSVSVTDRADAHSFSRATRSLHLRLPNALS